MSITALVVVSLACVAFANIVLLTKLLEHRTDRSPRENPFGGPSRWWQMNVLVLGRYDAAGERLRRWLWSGLTVQGLLIVVLVVRLSRG